MPPTTDASQPETDPDPTDAPAGIDPDDPPSDVDALYVCSASSSGRRYHVDPECDRLKAGASSRRVEIAAEWYDPCRYCVTDEFPRPPDGGGDGAE